MYLQVADGILGRAATQKKKFWSNLDGAAILTNTVPLGWSAVLSTLVRFFQIPLETVTQSL